MSYPELSCYFGYLWRGGRGKVTHSLGKVPSTAQVLCGNSRIKALKVNTCNSKKRNRSKGRDKSAENFPKSRKDMEGGERLFLSRKGGGEGEGETDCALFLFPVFRHSKLRTAK